MSGGARTACCRTAPQSPGEVETQHYKQQIAKATTKRWLVSGDEMADTLFSAKRAAVTYCAPRLARGYRLQLLDRRTGLYLDPATGKPLPASGQLTAP